MDASLVRGKLEGYGIPHFDELLTDAAGQMPDLPGSGQMLKVLEETVPPELATRTLRSSEWLEGVAVLLQKLLTGLREELAADNHRGGQAGGS